MGCSSSSSVDTVEEKNKKQNIDIEEEKNKKQNIDIEEEKNKKQNIDIEDDSIVPKDILDKLCETIIRIENENKISTGFFIKININEKKHNYIITSAYSITKEDIDSKNTISFFYSDKKETEKKIELDNNKRFIKCFIDDDIDATIIEILPEDKIPEDKYLKPDFNYESDYGQYINSDIYTAGYSNIDKYKIDMHSGQILGFRDNKNNQNFIHDCKTNNGLSGSPFIDINKNVIGINLQNNNNEFGNNGVFIGVIIDKLLEEERKKTIDNKKDNDTKEEKDEEINNIIEEENNKPKNTENNNINNINIYNKMAVYSKKENENNSEEDKKNDPNENIFDVESDKNNINENEERGNKIKGDNEVLTINKNNNKIINIKGNDVNINNKLEQKIEVIQIILLIMCLLIYYQKRSKIQIKKKDILNHQKWQW